MENFVISINMNLIDCIGEGSSRYVCTLLNITGTFSIGMPPTGKRQFFLFPLSAYFLIDVFCVVFPILSPSINCFFFQIRITLFVYKKSFHINESKSRVSTV